MPQPDESVIASLAEQDQKDRGEYLKSPTPENWQYVTERDKLRRTRVLELMEQDNLSTADDYFNAGLIMLHGISADEATLSHVFAMAALAKGHPAAAWLSAVTLDSMMQGLEQGQIFDTYPPVASKTVHITETIRKIFRPPSSNDESSA